MKVDLTTPSDQQAVYYVSCPEFPFFPGTGGTESFTFGHIRELRRRGVDARIVTVGQKGKDGRDQLPDIPFLDVDDEAALSELDATLVGVVDPFIVPTKRPAFIIAHVPPESTAYAIEHYQKAVDAGHTLVVNSKYSQERWAKRLRIPLSRIPVVYPFARPAFAQAQRKLAETSATRVLYAGRLHITKGIYLLLEALHHPQLQQGYSFTVTTARGLTSAQGHDKQGEEIAHLLKAHPRINLVEPLTTPEGMPRLLAEQDILVMPSNHHFWQEAFGMLSVEAQHAGCRVVAANTGGLPETDCRAGTFHVFEPGNSLALAKTIEEARLAGPVSQAHRSQATQQYTLAQSVDSLQKVIQAA